jgi:hypothetical protein
MMNKCSECGKGTRSTRCPKCVKKIELAKLVVAESGLFQYISVSVIY